MNFIQSILFFYFHSVSILINSSFYCFLFIGFLWCSDHVDFIYFLIMITLTLFLSTLFTFFIFTHRFTDCLPLFMKIFIRVIYISVIINISIFLSYRIKCFRHLCTLLSCLSEKSFSCRLLFSFGNVKHIPISFQFLFGWFNFFSSLFHRLLFVSVPIKI